MHADYLIVGAGPAGCALGYLLRQSGADVLILELCDLATKDKLCGGILGRGAVDFFEEIYGPGTLEALDPKPIPWKMRCLHRELLVDDSVVALPRQRFDRYVLDRYLESGGTVCDRMRLDSLCMAEHTARCTDLRTREKLSVSFGTIVGADGVSSAVRRLLTGRRQRSLVSVQGTAPRTVDDIVFSYDISHVGYCWYIPVGDEAYVGCGYYEEPVSTCRSKLASFCDEMGLEPQHMRGAPIPTGDDVLLAPAPDAWLLGDAAGLIDPRTSGGLAYALVSAERLADSLLGGTPYEEGMEKIVAHILSEAASVSKRYFVRALLIAKKGQPLDRQE